MEEECDTDYRLLLTGCRPYRPVNLSTASVRVRTWSFS
jgi:hypothetical protein